MCPFGLDENPPLARHWIIVMLWRHTNYHFLIDLESLQYLNSPTQKSISYRLIRGLFVPLIWYIVQVFLEVISDKPIDSSWYLSEFGNANVSPSSVYISNFPTCWMNFVNYPIDTSIHSTSYYSHSCGTHGIKLQFNWSKQRLSWQLMRNTQKKRETQQ